MKGADKKINQKDNKNVYAVSVSRRLCYRRYRTGEWPVLSRFFAKSV
jgi:hypothetical protein